NWSSGFMPATYQGVVLRPKGEPILDLAPPPGMTRAMQRRLIDAKVAYDEAHRAARSDNSELDARIASYELAFKMQQHAPEAVDVGDEPEHVRRLYGLDDPRTEKF